MDGRPDELERAPSIPGPAPGSRLSHVAPAAADCRGEAGRNGSLPGFRRRSSRRAVLKTATPPAPSVPCAARVMPAGAVAGRGSVAITAPLETFAYSDVELLAGPMKRQFEENHAVFLNLDDDRLLKVFRQVAGLPAPGEDMGGWYDLTGFSLTRSDFHGFIAGPTFWPYVSGLSR